MQRSNIFFALAITAFMALASTTGFAQNNGAAALKKRVAEHVASGTPVPPAETLESANPAIELPFAQQGGILDIVERQKRALLGTWSLTLTFSDGSSVKSTLNVFPGRDDNEGSVLHAAEASLLLPNPTTPEQGVWQHAGGLQFIASYRGYAVDATFEHPAGTVGFRHAITVNSDQESFTGRAVFEVKDDKGAVVFSDNITTKGTRQRAVAP
ncbi:MAG: hypothetical protein HYR56_02720 [Acidobacteria bacterium]|nr:hypothetical protein [Acidobacteriota bacterium]MBI3422665.1 hypothetical protein [Acidobacteriota bacterium]